MPIWFYNVVQAVCLVLAFAAVFTLVTWLMKKAPMVSKDFVAAFAVGIIIAVLLSLASSIIGRGFAEGFVHKFKQSNVTFKIVTSRDSTNAERSREH